MRALALIASSLLLVSAAAAQPGKPWTYDVYGPGGYYGPAKPIRPGLKPKPPVVGRPGLPSLPAQPVRWWAANWEWALCYPVAFSVSPTLPPETQRLYLGKCPDRDHLYLLQQPEVTPYALTGRYR